LVDEALAWAIASPWPDPGTVMDHVYGPDGAEHRHA
jgi:hypothetical protein